MTVKVLLWKKRFIDNNLSNLIIIYQNLLTEGTAHLEIDFEVLHCFSEQFQCEMRTYFVLQRCIH